MLVGRKDSIPCRASFFAPGQFEERDELHQDNMNRINCTQDDMKKRMNSSRSSNHPGIKKLLRQGTVSSLYPKQQPRPLPSLLSLTFSMLTPLTKISKPVLSYRSVKQANYQKTVLQYYLFNVLTPSIIK